MEDRNANDDCCDDPDDPSLLQFQNVGQYVTRGTLVGYAGATGTVTACHLHFEVYLNGHTVDPMTILGPVP